MLMHKGNGHTAERIRQIMNGSGLASGTPQRKKIMLTMQKSLVFS